MAINYYGTVSFGSYAGPAPAGALTAILFVSWGLLTTVGTTTGSAFHWHHAMFRW